MAQVAPVQEDLAAWADAPTDAITFPILSDEGWQISNRFEVDFGIPTYSLIGRNMEVLIVDGSVTPAAIEEALAEPVPEVDWDEPPDLGGDDGDASEDEAAQAAESAGPLTGGPFGGGETAPEAGSSEGGPFGGCPASLAGEARTGAPALGLSSLLWFGLAFRRRRN